MFPVLSLLRRTAANVVYVTPDNLELVGEKLCLRLERAAEALDFSSGKWGKPSDKHLIYVLRAEEPSAQATAIALTKKENGLAEAIKATETLYTLVLGQEDELVVNPGLGETYRRTARLAVVRGVFRSTAPKLLSPVRQKGRMSVSFRKPPPGAVHERR